MNIYERPQGLWLPLVTPFDNGTLDEASLRALIRHYCAKNISGIILAATTGEGQLLCHDETERLAKTSADEMARLQAEQKLYLGLSGSDPAKLSDEMAQTTDWPIDGYLVSGPNYLRPSQDGLLTFFTEIAKSTDKPIILYNIPYRTGVNVDNETMLALAEISNIVGVKDCCGNAQQSYDLLRGAPDTFSVLTGEDPFFYNAMVHGAPGAIVTGAHVLVDQHLQIMNEITNGNQEAALEIWNQVVHIPRLLFAEPNPAPLKYWLYREGLLKSAEVRVPFMPISSSVRSKIDAELDKC